MLDWIEVDALTWQVKEFDAILRDSPRPHGPGTVRTGVVISVDVCGIMIGMEEWHQVSGMISRPQFSSLIVFLIKLISINRSRVEAAHTMTDPLRWKDTLRTQFSLRERFRSRRRPLTTNRMYKTNLTTILDALPTGSRE